MSHSDELALELKIEQLKAALSSAHSFLTRENSLATDHERIGLAVAELEAALTGNEHPF